jgi:hypothetical protein
MEWLTRYLDPFALLLLLLLSLLVLVLPSCFLSIWSMRVMNTVTQVTLSLRQGPSGNLITGELRIITCYHHGYGSQSNVLHTTALL